MFLFGFRVGPVNSPLRSESAPVAQPPNGPSILNVKTVKRLDPQCLPYYFVRHFDVSKIDLTPQAHRAKPHPLGVKWAVLQTDDIFIGCIAYYGVLSLVPICCRVDAEKKCRKGTPKSGTGIERRKGRSTCKKHFLTS